MKLWINPAVDTAARTPSPRSPSDGPTKVDARKRSTETSVRNIPTATAMKVGGKNVTNQRTVFESKCAKKGTPATSKNASPNVNGSANKTELRPPEALKRNVSDSDNLTIPTAVCVTSKPAARSQNTKK